MKVILSDGYYGPDTEVETNLIKIETSKGTICIDYQENEVQVWAREDDQRVAVSAVATEQGEILRIEIVENK